MDLHHHAQYGRAQTACAARDRGEKFYVFCWSITLFNDKVCANSIIIKLFKLQVVD